MIRKIFSNKQGVVRNYLIEPLTGIISILLYAVNVIVGISILTLVSILKIFPFTWNYYQVIVKHLQYYWVKGNIFIQRTMIPQTKWKVHFKSDVAHPLQTDDWYLLISNHQNWIDILVLQRVFNGRIPPIKFFLKSQLAWILPLVTWGCWLLDFPFIRRYSLKQLIRNPNTRRRNLTMTKKMCQRYQLFPTTIANFVEGRRFTSTIQESQNSPYRYLLKPQAAGIAICIKNLHPQLYKLLDVTIVYTSSRKTVNFWNFLCGRLGKIDIDVKVSLVDPALIGDYENDKIFRMDMQKWLNHTWLQKDQLIGKNKVFTK